MIPVGLDDIVLFVIRADVDYEELIKDPQRVQDHIVAVTGLKGLQFGDFTYISIWVSASYIGFTSGLKRMPCTQRPNIRMVKNLVSGRALLTGGIKACGSIATNVLIIYRCRSLP